MISSALAQTSNLVFLDGIASQRENSGCAIEKAVAGQRRIQGGNIRKDRVKNLSTEERQISFFFPTRTEYLREAGCILGSSSIQR